MTHRDPLYVGDLGDLALRVEDMLADACARAVTEYPLDDVFVYQEALPFLRECAHGPRRSHFRRWHGIPEPGADMARTRAWVASYRSNWRRQHKAPEGAGPDVTDAECQRAHEMVRAGWSTRHAASALGRDPETLHLALARWRRLHAVELTREDSIREAQHG